MGDTLADLYREVGIGSTAPAWQGYAATAPRPRRPLPRTMRPAEQRMNDPRLSRESQWAAAVERAPFRDMGLDRMIRDAPRAAEESRRQYVQELRAMPRTGRLPQMVRDLPGDVTGINPAIRSVQAFGAGDAQAGAMEGLSALATIGTLGVGGRAALPRTAPRLPMRAAPEPSPPVLPNGPVRELGRASDGSVMPVAPSQPFRNSLRGGSEDLSEAAGMRAPEASAPIVAYHGTPVRNKTSFYPWSHHGTQRAARDRLRETGRRGLFGRRGDVLETEIAPGRVVDLADDGDSTRAVFSSPSATITELRRIGEFDDADWTYITEPLEVARANRKPGEQMNFNGYSVSDEIERRAAEVLTRKGVSALRYRNAFEDPGSYSYVVPDPSRVSVRPRQNGPTR